MDDRPQVEAMADQEELNTSIAQEQIRQIYEISQAIIAGLSLDELLVKILDVCMELFHANAVVCWLVSDKGSLELLAGRGLSKEYISITTRQPLGDTASGQVAFEARPWAVTDIAAEMPDPVRELCEVEGITAFLGVPLLNGRQVIGVLSTYYHAKRSFDAGEIAVLATIANMAAAAIANQRLQAESVATLYALSRQKELLDRVMKNAQDGIVALDRQRRIVLWSPACERLLGWSATEVLGRPFEMILHGSTPAGMQNTVVYNLIHSEVPVPALEVELVTRNGKQRWMSASWAPIHEGGREPSPETSRGAVMILRDISASKEIDRAKSSLIAMIGHELRTPLTAIRALSELLRDHTFPRRRQREIVTNIYDEAIRLSRLVDQVLDAAKIDARRMPFEPRPTELEPIFRQAASAIQVAMQRTVTVDLPPDLPPVRADPDRLRQIVDNLLANAATYSAPDSEIVLAAEVGSDRVTISVSDRGTGIAPEKIPHIWERFYRAEPLDTPKTGGTGLGLHIVKGLVELHGGTISVDSRPGAGSTFRVSLPRSGI